MERLVVIVDVSVFDAFPEAVREYEFLQISRGTIVGDVISSITKANGIFKFKTGVQVAESQENRQSTSTLHIMPTESFITLNKGNLVGHGVRIDGNDYMIEGQTGGDNFANMVHEHITLILTANDFSDYQLETENED